MANKMTKREQVVERVRAMVVRKDPHISYENAGDIARAAIAECEKDRYADRDEPMRVLHDLTPGGSEYVNDPVACGAYLSKVKSDMIEAKMDRVKLQKAMRQLEAQCAEMRAGLEKYGRHEPNCVQSNKDYGDPDKTCTCAFGEALSPDAGRRVLDVVMAAYRAKTRRRWVDITTSVPTKIIAVDPDAEAVLDNALSALGWKRGDRLGYCDLFLQGYE